MDTVYFHSTWDETPEEFLGNLSKQTSGEDCIWGDVCGVIDPDEADYHVAFNSPSPELNAERTLLLPAEPPVSYRYTEWDDADCLKTYPIEEYYMPQRWWIDASYDTLRHRDSPEKTANLSWVTTDKGREVGSLGRWSRRIWRRIGISEQLRMRTPLVNRGGTDGHVLRMALLDRILDINPELLDLYGRGDFAGPHYCGEIADKWDGLADYRYSLAIENYSGPNYFSEKLTDALLAWCMPIYWGCTNLGEYLPEESYVWIDIEADDAPERVREIVESDLREQNLDAIAEARRRLLDEYQIWPTVERAISDLDG